MNARFVALAVYVMLYWGLTLLSGMVGLASGAVQFRLSEALSAFAGLALTLAAIVGLTLGTAVGNATTSSMGLVDVVVGSVLTLIAAIAMHSIGPRVVALAAPVAANAVGVGLMLCSVLDVPLWLGVGGVALGEAVVMFTAGFGSPTWLRRHGDLVGIPHRAARRDPGTADKDG